MSPIIAVLGQHLNCPIPIEIKMIFFCLIGIIFGLVAIIWFLLKNSINITVQVEGKKTCRNAESQTEWCRKDQAVQSCPNMITKTTQAGTSTGEQSSQTVSTVSEGAVFTPVARACLPPIPVTGLTLRPPMSSSLVQGGCNEENLYWCKKALEPPRTPVITKNIYECDECENTTFNTLNELYKHMSKHTLRKKFIKRKNDEGISSPPKRIRI